MVIQIIGFCIGLCLPEYFTKKLKEAKDNEEWNKRHALCEMIKRDREMYKASDYLRDKEKNGYDLVCSSNDKICDELLQKYKKGSINVSIRDWYNIVVPLCQRVGCVKK